MSPPSIDTTSAASSGTGADKHPLYPILYHLTILTTRLYYALLFIYLLLTSPRHELKGLSEKEYSKYSLATLKLYDLALNWNCWLYGISKEEMLRVFDEGLSEEHADVGPGSGYYPFHSQRLPKLLSSSRKVVYHALDIHSTSLLYLTSRLTRRFPPTTHPTLTLKTDVFDALDSTRAAEEFGQSVQTMNMHFLFHCIAPPPATGGDAASKFEAILRSAWEMLKPGGRLCGTTILDPLAPSTPIDSVDPLPAITLSGVRLLPALALIQWFQSVGVFHNQGDSLSKLLLAAEKVGFQVVDVQVRGVIALFVFKKEESR